MSQKTENKELLALNTVFFDGGCNL